MPDAPLTIAAAGRQLRAGQTTARELTETCLAAIQAQDARLRAFVTVTADRARADADRADAELRAGRDRGPLHGIPVALKDLVETAGIRTTAGSAVLADFVPERDAWVAARLAESGTVLLGKTNTHEFALGVFTPPTRNPWNPDHVPGGSSGGSAAAVAAGMALGAIGTDTGGSIRIPGAACGITGLKPTYGTIPTDGIIPLSDALDHAGPLARTAEDCALLMDALAPGGDWHARTVIPDGAPPLALLGGLWQTDIDPAIAAAVEIAARLLDPDIPTIEPPALSAAEWLRVYRGIQGPEAAQAHQERGWYPQRAGDYSERLRTFLERNSAVPATTYISAQRERAQIQARWAEWQAASGATLFLAPTLALPAPTVADSADPERARHLGDALLRLTLPINLLGWPALTVPCGFTSSGLPIGLQIIAPSGRDRAALALGHRFQQATEWHRRRA